MKQTIANGKKLAWLTHLEPAFSACSMESSSDCGSSQDKSCLEGAPMTRKKYYSITLLILLLLLLLSLLLLVFLLLYYY